MLIIHSMGMYQSLNYKGVVNAQLILYSHFFLLIND